MADELDAVGRALGPVVVVAQEVFEAGARAAEGASSENVDAVARAAALRFVRERIEQLAEQLLELGAALAAAAGTEVVMTVVEVGDGQEGR